MISMLNYKLDIRGIELEKKREDKVKLEYFSVHITQLLVGLLLLSVGVITVLHFDYGNISFLFAVPHFFLTGLIPTLISLLILIRNFAEAEKISISSDNFWTLDMPVIFAARTIAMTNTPNAIKTGFSIKLPPLRTKIYYML